MTNKRHPTNKSLHILGLSIPVSLAEEIQRELLRAALQLRSSAARVHGGGGFYARRSQRVYRLYLGFSFVIIIMAPMIFATAYVLAIPNRYVTESRITVSSQTNPMSGMLSGLMSRENYGESYLTSYIESSNIVSALQENDYNLLNRSGVLHENAAIAAITQRVPSLERKLELWGHHVIADRQSFTSTIELSVAALTAESSQKLHEKILSLAEQHINTVSERQRSTQVAEATESLQAAQTDLRDAIGRLHDIRQKYNMIDPELEATQRIMLIYQMEQQQTNYRQSLEVLQRRNIDDPQIGQLTSQVEALEIQKEELRQSIAGTVRGNVATVAEAASEMSLFEADVTIARDEVARRMFQLSEARQNAIRQGMFLQKSVSPVLPQTPRKAPKLLYWFVCLVSTIVVWLAMAAMGALIRDHAR